MLCSPRAAERTVYKEKVINCFHEMRSTIRESAAIGQWIRSSIFFRRLSVLPCIYNRKKFEQRGHDVMRSISPKFASPFVDCCAFYPRHVFPKHKHQRQRTLPRLSAPLSPHRCCLSDRTRAVRNENSEQANNAQNNGER